MPRRSANEISLLRLPTRASGGRAESRNHRSIASHPPPRWRPVPARHPRARARVDDKTEKNERPDTAQLLSPLASLRSLLGALCAGGGRRCGVVLLGGPLDEGFSQTTPLAGTLQRRLVAGRGRGTAWQLRRRRTSLRGRPARAALWMKASPRQRLSPAHCSAGRSQVAVAALVALGVSALAPRRALRRRRPFG